MRLFQQSQMPPPGNRKHMHHEIAAVTYSYCHSLSVGFTLTKKPAQNGQDCLTRGVVVKAMLVKEKAKTMAPKPRWHSPR